MLPQSPSHSFTERRQEHTLLCDFPIRNILKPMVEFTKRVAVLSLVALTLAQAQTQQRFAILEPGVYHGQDVPLRQPISWVGVYCKDNACRAHAIQIRSTRVPDPLGDDDP